MYKKNGKNVFLKFGYRLLDRKIMMNILNIINEMFLNVIWLNWFVKNVWWDYINYKNKFMMMYLKNKLVEMELFCVVKIICVIFWMV